MNLFNYKKDIKLKKIKWCLGCGNYSIIIQLCKALQKLKISKKKNIIISGIGCSSRLPYYIKSYGIHTIHGRAFSIATGIKLSNKKFNVWVITGDGDSFSIGLSHLLHTIRRDININILIFNNGIFALTKGQISNTNFNNNNKSFNTISLMLSAGATFVARTLYSNINHLKKIFIKANNHIGTSCIEIYQNCPIYNNFKNKINNILYLENNKPLIFNNKCIIFKNKLPKISNIKKINNNNIWIHNINNIYKSYLLSNFNIINNNFPIPFGIFYKKKIKKIIIKKYKKYQKKILKLLKKNIIL